MSRPSIPFELIERRFGPVEILEAQQRNKIAFQNWTASTSHRVHLRSRMNAPPANRGD